MIDSAILKSEERAIFALRSIYKQYGYLPYKMSKFEEYDLYLKNKDFLLSDRIITFNDTTGKLLALKPDVTLSIIKNAENTDGSKYKVYYNENVYRVTDGAGQYKEIMQTGLECIGEVGVYEVYESVLLAAKSLAAISERFVLDISELDILTAALDLASPDESFRAAAIRCIRDKNEHDLERLCREAKIADPERERLIAFASMRAKLSVAIPELEKYARGEAMTAAINEIKTLDALLCEVGLSEKIFFDFSVINDMNYYSGTVFRGFIDGIPTAVLAGGRYDKLIGRMGKSAGGIGFAIYLDRIESISAPSEYDVDVLLLCEADDAPEDIARAMTELTRDGSSVRAESILPEGIRYRRLVRLGEVKK